MDLLLAPPNADQDSPAWLAEARCGDSHVDPDLFFVETPGAMVAAGQLCAACPVRVDCLEHALDLEEGEPADMRAGVWAGTSPAERAALARGPVPATDSGSLAVDLVALLIGGNPVPSWYPQAACADVDTEVFYPGRGQSTAPAKALCEGCDVRADCLDHILELEAGATRAERVGVWAGTSPDQRHTMRDGRISEDRGRISGR